MPDIDIFDPLAYFEQRIKELEQEVIAKKARAAILQANQTNLEETLSALSQLNPEQQRALQVEVASLTEARNSAKRAIDALNGEIEALTAKLSALRAALSLLQRNHVACAQSPPRGNGEGRSGEE
ncbi:MAG: hypothetical protein DIU70_012800 [Bacillota bacterium]